MTVTCEMSVVKRNLAPSLSNDHSGVLCHVTFYFFAKYTIGDIYLLFDTFSSPGPGFTKGLSLDLDLNLRLLSLIQAKSLVLYLADFTKHHTLSFG